MQAWPIALLPVLCFLAVLLWLDSHKLVPRASVAAALLGGAACAVGSYGAGAVLLPVSRLDVVGYGLFIAPLVEELLKGALLVAAVRTHRIGFLVDAAILGFAVGCGFALLENVYYLHAVGNADVTLWVVRGFGTALMHGGATALFAIAGLAMVESRQRMGLAAFGPGYLIAVLLHMAFNRFVDTPREATLGVLIALPPLMFAVFAASERALARWLWGGFDSDMERLSVLRAGELSASPLGAYLKTLRGKFEPLVLADLLCYLRLHAELSLRAKGLLMMREQGFEAPLDDETRAKLAELRYLRRRIGRTGLLALHPVLRQQRRERWQLRMLERQ